MIRLSLAVVLTKSYRLSVLLFKTRNASSNVISISFSHILAHDKYSSEPYNGHVDIGDFCTERREILYSNGEMPMYRSYTGCPPFRADHKIKVYYKRGHLSKVANFWYVKW